MEVYAVPNVEDMAAVSLKMPGSKSRPSAAERQGFCDDSKRSRCDRHQKACPEPFNFGMSKTPLSQIQKVVSSVWEAVRLLEDRPALTSKVKLHGRRGYGDADIPGTGPNP
jgi:hypothetical protein